MARAGMKSFHSFLPVLGLAYLLLAQGTANVMNSVKWSALPSNKVVLNTATAHVTYVRSKVECARHCWRDVICRQFCYNVTNKLCYLSGVSTSQSPVPENTGTQCYYEDWCPVLESYWLLGGKCIRSSKVKASYTDARDTCAAEGGHLYHYKSLELDKQPLEDLMALDGFPDSYWSAWVGADDLDVEGQFVWSDGSPLPTTSEVWKDGQPDNLSGKEDCVHARSDIYLLNDAPCGSLMWFVCQLDKPAQ